MNLAAHADHKWSQQGRCVWCDTCGTRLYQGELPDPGKQKDEAICIDRTLNEIRERLVAKSKKEWEERTPEQHRAWEEGRSSYVAGESVLDRMERGNPYKGTPLAVWFNRGWSSAETSFFKKEANHEQEHHLPEV